MGIERKATELFKNGPKSIGDRALLTTLGGVEQIYSWGVNFWASMYEAGHLKQHRLHAYTISVGNIVAGGTGKTPFVQYMARRLQKAGERVAILSRGYRGASEHTGAIVSNGAEILLNAEQAGDEPYLLARTLPGVIVAVGKNRAAIGAQVEKLLHPTVILLDDGFQHWALRRDYDIVLIDSTNPFSNGRVLPRGLLREPLDHLERADAYVVTKSDLVTEKDRAEIARVLAHFRAHVPLLWTKHRPLQPMSYAQWRKHATAERETLPRRFITLCALGNPASFEATVAAAGLVAHDHLRLPDHHAYTQDDIRHAEETATKAGAQGIIVSEKDAVKLQALQLRESFWYVLPMELMATKGEDAFWEHMEDEWETGR